MSYFWQTKRFKSREAMMAWIERNSHRIQWNEIFAINSYRIEYRRLRVVEMPQPTTSR